MKKRLLSSIRIAAICLFLPPVFVQGQTTVSVLSDGKLFKIAVPASGIYKLDANFLSSVAGIDLNQTAAENITLWTNGGGVLPQLTTAPRIDDLREVAMHGVGTADGKVDAGDFFLFFAEGPDHWTYHAQDSRFRKTKNIYDTHNYYFISVSGRTAAGIATRQSLADAEVVINAYDAYASIEEDKVNLLGKFRAPGSGQRWFGDEFSVTRNRNYEVVFPNIAQNANVRWELDFAGRSEVTTAVSADFNGNKTSRTIGAVATGNGEASYALIATLTGSYTTSSPTQDITISYPAISSPSSGWLDFIEVQTQCALHYSGAPLRFRSIESANYVTAEFRVSGLTGNETIWDITDMQRPVRQEYTVTSGTGHFIAESQGQIREFIVFTPGTGYTVPEGSGAVANQNLHGITDADLVILYHPDFEEAAQRLADHRLAHNGYLVEMVSVDQVMNEFAGGGQDPTAIRDFARMLKNRSQRFRFMVFIGDGSYDFRHLNAEQDDENFVPVFETEESMHPIRSFPSDDYFALLSDDEGSDLKGAIEIAIGRLPVRTLAEANLVVDKIIHYDTDPATFGDWRLGLTYVADDEDSNTHLLQTEDVATDQAQSHPKYNLNKIYLDAYEQVTTPGGQRYPDVNAAINAAMQRGTLILNYLGHGGPAGWSQERVLGISDIQSWSNYNKLPVLITATCSFTPYDEPSLRSAGEMVFMSPSGGAVALLTTVRAVYSSSNKRLVSEVFERILLENAGSALSIGEVMVLAKNSNHQDTVDINARKFALIGDPSMRLAIPEHDIAVTEVNGNPVGTGVPDTARALEEVTIAGEVRDVQGAKLSQFNGIVNVTVFDKPLMRKTLANDPKSYEKAFETQSRVLFKGSASVVNGEFTIVFVIPQDIAFHYGNGKISMYATDGSSDASGYYKDLVIGGAGDISADDQGPEIDLFVDYEGFVSGGETGPNPTMLIRLSDDSGINITGTSIGHDLEGILNESSQNSYILNDLYIAAIDDPRSGEVILPLSGLAEGVHTFRVVAWDIANNYSEKSIEFRVVNDPGNVIRNLQNGPNPFRTETMFAFQHQLGDVPLHAEIEIFSANGTLVKHLEWPNVISRGGKIENLTWNGSAGEGGMVLPGVYVYRVLLTSYPGTSQEQSYESKFGKLIVVN